MKYYKYQSPTRMSEVWSLFRDMGDAPQGSLVDLPEYSHTLDIIKAALSGTIALSSESVENFNLAAYEYKCRENDKNNKFEKAKKEVHIVEFDNSEDDNKVGFGDVSDRKLHYADDAFEKVSNDDEFESNLRDLLNYRDKYIIEKGVDLVSILVGALKGIPHAVEVLRNLVSLDEKISSIVTSLCSNSNGTLLGVLECIA